MSDVAPLFVTKTGKCRGCKRAIYYHPTGCVWLHVDTSITVCDALSSTITKATPMEDQQ